MLSPLADGQRKLATVLAADAVGFSRRMGRNERAAVAALLECRALMAEIVAAFRGTTVGTPGDFFLALLPSGAEAIEAALEIQGRLAERNLAVEEARRAEYRIGVSIGDVYAHGGDIVGDAVNVASRLQAIAPPGGIIVSGAVRDVVGPGEPFAFEYLGDHALKNLTTPVRVYTVVGLHGRDLPASDGTAPTAGECMRPVDRLPVRPVIEIEPFKALTGSENERLFATGLVEELVTILAGVPNSLAVRQTGAPSGPAAAAGAVECPRLYSLSGSVRRATETLRITARLTVQGSGEAIWADRFEYEASQSFDAQDVIAREVVTAIQITLTEGEQAQLWSKATTSVRAWELFQRGHDMERRFTRHGHREARRHYQAALDRDPGYLSAAIALAFCHLDEIRLGWTEDAGRSFAEAEMLHERAAGLDPDHPERHALLAYIELHRRNDEGAVAAMERAVRLAPWSGELAAYLGTIYHTVGRYRDAIDAYRRAMGLTSHFPTWIAANLGFALCDIGQLHEARKTFLGILAHHPDYVRAHLGLAIAYRRLGLMSDALAAVAELRRLDPLFTIEQWAQDRPYSDPAVIDALVAEMQGLGLTMGPCGSRGGQ